MIFFHEDGLELTFRKTNMMKRIAILIFMVIFCWGCSTSKSQFVGIKNYIRGEHYLQAHNYSKGLTTFEKEVLINPDNAGAHYYLGRFALAEKKQEKGLKHLKRAVELSPGNADFHFWLGVAYSANTAPEEERRSYRLALSLDKDHVQALIYLGHNQFERKAYREALANYSRALKLSPNDPQALYNRALILRVFQRTPEEIKAWMAYLEYYPTGAFARNAVEHLNKNGNFEYRNYLIGNRTVSLKKIRFEHFSTTLMEESLTSLDFVGYLMTKYRDFILHIIVYQKNNVQLAKSRTLSIKNYILEKNPKIPYSRIKTSWFGEVERLQYDRKTYTLSSSVQLFTELAQSK
jgi:tetratricopeptide (TPR) repeat protein